MKNRSMWIVMALGATVVANASPISSINSIKVYERFWNDYSASSLNVVNNYPSSVSITDNGLTSTGGGFANRHVLRFSNDNGATDFIHDGGNDTFEFYANATVTLPGYTGGQFPRRIETGPLSRTPIIGGWHSDFQGILTNDGEVACFGAPVPFYSFTTQQSSNYVMGTTVQVGFRYFRDTDNKMKGIWYMNNQQSPALTLELISGAEGTWDFSKYGFRPDGYTWNGGGVMSTNFGFYVQIMPNNGDPTTLNGSVNFSNISMSEYGVKGHVSLNNIVTDGAWENVHVELWQGGVLKQSMDTQIDSLGRFSFRSTVPAGTYDVLVKGDTHLAKLTSGVVLGATGGDCGNFSLTNGDVDNNNEVGPGDFAVLSGAFGTSVGDTGFVQGADLDRDTEVGPSDFSILSTNFGTSGD